MTPFDLALNRAIHFGSGKLALLSGLVKDSLPHGGSGLVLILGRNAEERSPQIGRLLTELKAEYRVQTILVSGEPDSLFIDESAERIRATGITGAVIAIGGGSVIDTGKALAFLLADERIGRGGKNETICAYLEGIQTLGMTDKCLPLFAVPTTAGTGSEATKNAVITVRGEKPAKRSLRGDALVPDTVILDPELLSTCAPSVIAASGLDAITQLIESYLSVKASELTDALALSGLRMALPALRGWYGSRRNGTGSAACGDVLYGAWLSGITLAHAGLGVVHGIASPLGARFDIPHGVLCGRLLGPSLSAIPRRIMSGNTAYGKLKIISDIIGVESPADIGPFFTRLADSMALPRLKEFGLTGEMCAGEAGPCSNKNSPGSLSVEDRVQILEEAL